MTTTAITTARQLTALSRTTNDALRRYRNSVSTTASGSLTIRSDNMPTDEERETFSARLAEINNHMQTDVAELRRLVTSIFLWFTPTSAAAGTLEASVEAYTVALKGLPLWTIVEAAKAIRKSSATFRPSLPELYDLAQSKAAALLDERASIVAVLTATAIEPTPEGERARVAAGFKRLLAELEATNVVGKRAAL